MTTPPEGGVSDSYAWWAVQGSNLRPVPRLEAFLVSTALVALAVIAAGCTIVPDAPVVQSAVLSDGRPGLKAQCRGALLDWDACYAAAAKACPGGFVADRRDENVLGYVSMHKGDASAVIGRTLVFACK